MRHASVIDSFYGLYVIIVFEGEGVDTRIDTERLTYSDAAHALRDYCASMLVVDVRICCIMCSTTCSIIVGRTEKIVSVILLRLDLLLNILFEVISIVICELIGFLFYYC